jgi:hypothetical protein
MVGPLTIVQELEDLKEMTDPSDYATKIQEVI